MASIICSLIKKYNQIYKKKVYYSSHVQQEDMGSNTVNFDLMRKLKIDKSEN